MHLAPQVLEQIEGLVSNSNFSDGEMTSNHLERLGREGPRGCRRKGGVLDLDQGLPPPLSVWDESCGGEGGSFSVKKKKTKTKTKKPSGLHFQLMPLLIL